jgi:lipoprotein-releasing system permease protein
MVLSDDEKRQLRRNRLRGLVEIAIGGALVAVGFGLTVWTYKEAKPGGRFLIAYGPIIGGGAFIARGVLRFLDLGFESSISMRYLMARHRRVSRIAVGAAALMLLVGITGVILDHVLLSHAKGPFDLEDRPQQLANVITGVKIGGFVLCFIALVIGGLRYFYTFFTTVPMVGVWIGTMALVCVLSVMSGFENDLREKILGANAHIQVTREEGDLTDWREVKDRIDHIPGVVASTPYATSEVLLAANSNGMNVIIKGIDPKTVGKVTELVKDLEDPDAMKRLEPLVADPHDLRVTPATPRGDGKVIDPPPPDMPRGGDPIDFTKPAETGSAAAGSAPESPQPAAAAPAGSAAGSPQPAAALPRPAAPSAGSATPPAGSAAGSQRPARPAGSSAAPPPAPSALAAADEPGGEDEPPVDRRQPSNGSGDPSIHVVDNPDDQLAVSRRTQSLSGVLVGRELVKQTHLYTGEEVRLISPLSDPSNPDANGTPIPFNRDYRVAGIFFTGMYEYDLKYVYVTLDSLQDFLDRGDAVDGIEVRIGSPDDTDAFVRKIGDELGPKYRVQDWKDLNRSLFSALKLEKVAMFLVLGIVILVASFSIVGNLIMVVVEKAREIALLKTLGASDRMVMAVFAIQGVWIGLIGTALGIGTGLAACWAGDRWGIPLNPDVYYIDRMPVHVETGSVMVTAALGVLISVAATFYPAIVAARVRPAAGMRH